MKRLNEAAGYAMKQTRGSNKMVANTVFGFGLAHVGLGVIDLASEIVKKRVLVAPSFFLYIREPSHDEYYN
ncbi:hypothetical protein [Peribacillus simplex]|uniref:hypothetical protein n=1 Tax=Peribacillus simplex TaxID=1478 RepID=UPI003D2E5783